MLQLDLGVAGGILGGPVFDESGRVIAVAAARPPGTNVSLAVSAQAIEPLVARVCARSPPAGGYPPEEESARQAHERALDHALGEGVPRSYPTAARILEENCRRDHGPSCRDLSALHHAGHLGPRDVDRARTLLRKACTLGAPDACKDLWRIFAEC